MKEYAVRKIECPVRMPKEIGSQKFMVSGAPRGIGATGMKKSVIPTLSITEDFSMVIIRGVVRDGKAQPPYLLPVTFGGGVFVQLAEDPNPPEVKAPETPPTPPTTEQAPAKAPARAPQAQKAA